MSKMYVVRQDSASFISMELLVKQVPLLRHSLSSKERFASLQDSPYKMDVIRVRLNGMHITGQSYNNRAPLDWRQGLAIIIQWVPQEALPPHNCWMFQRLTVMMSYSLLWKGKCIWTQGTFLWFLIVVTSQEALDIVSSGKGACPRCYDRFNL